MGIRHNGAGFLLMFPSHNTGPIMHVCAGTVRNKCLEQSFLVVKANPFSLVEKLVGSNPRKTV